MDRRNGQVLSLFIDFLAFSRSPSDIRHSQVSNGQENLIVMVSGVDSFRNNTLGGAVKSGRE